MISINEQIGDLERTIRDALRAFGLSLWSALPGIVVSVNHAAQTVHVQPAIKGILARPQGKALVTALPVLPDVPIVHYGAGGVTITAPVKAGDECLVVFADRCIDGWWQAGGIQMPADARQHDLSDGFAIFGPRSQPRRLNNVSEHTLQIRSDDGQAWIELDPANHAVQVTTPGRVSFKAQAVHIEATRTDFQGEVWANGKRIDDTHRHRDVLAGSAVSGPVK